jgi:serine/threonine protein kinase
MDVSPEMLDNARKEFDLDSKLEGVQAEANQIADEVIFAIESIDQDSQDNSLDHQRTVLGFGREDRSGMMQRIRGKENIQYTSPEGEEFFAKYVNQQEGQRDNIAGLKNEKHFLDLLTDSGVTPKSSELKIYQNGKRARLLMEQVPGVSLDKMDDEQSDEFLKKNTDDTIRSTAEALDKIHRRNVLLVDVNDGSFLVSQSDKGVSTHVVDFELAVDLNRKNSEDNEMAFRWYADKDLGLTLGEDIDHQDPEILKKAEISLWARTLSERMIGFGDITESVELPPDKQQEFDAIKAKIEPVLKDQILKEAEKDYQRRSAVPKEERFSDLPSKEDFLQQEIARELPRRIEEELLGLTLAEKIKSRGIRVSEKSLDFMSRALSLELKNRPSDFSELVG